jgi:hypothetical protein
VGGEGQELDGEFAGPGTEDEAAFVEVDEAEEESGSAADGVEGWLVGTVGGEGVVVAIEDGDGSGSDEGLHGGGLLGVGTDGEEAMPMSVFGGGAGAVVVEAGGGDLEGLDDGGRGDLWLVHGGGRGDYGDGLGGVGDVGLGGVGRLQIDWEELVDGDVLGGEDAVEAFEGQGTFAVEEIWDVGLLKSGLAGEARAGESTAFDSAEEFEAEEFVQVLKVHRAWRYDSATFTAGSGYERLWGLRFLRETISFDKTKIRRNVYFMQ